MKPIIESFLDTDFYKFTMGRLIFELYQGVWVKYAFTNRTKKVRLAEHIAKRDLVEQLDYIRDKVRINNSGLHYLRGTNEYQERMFPEDYLLFLKGLKFPNYQLRENGGTYEIEFSGNWSETIYWETIALPIINELYNKSFLDKLSKFEKDVIYAQGKVRLAEKIKILKTRPELTFCDFGTRRRFSRKWHEYVVKTLAEELPDQFLGTSNVWLAMKYGLLPMGTSAHELFMVMSGILGGSDESVHASHNQVLQDWWKTYDRGLSIALTDTYGSDFFFRDMTEEQARNWKGLRQDSGDPIEFGEKAIKFYQNYGIDPRGKLIVFSDGLDIETIVKIYDHFKGRILVTFGWGTNLTNDLGLGALSVVIKTVEANTRGLVKLSDNIAKAIGRPEDIERYKKIFGYTSATYQECRY